MRLWWDIALWVSAPVSASFVVPTRGQMAAGQNFTCLLWAARGRMRAHTAKPAAGEYAAAATGRQRL